MARSRDTFLAILGHDLRSPLSAIANSALYLGSPGLLPGGAALEAVQRISRGGAKMTSMVKDLLEYTRVRLGRAIPISPEPANMDQICKAAIDEIRAAHPERVFRLETAGELDGHFDGERLQRALANLLSNAVHHGSRYEPITLRAFGEPDKVTVQVKNYGRPIPTDQLMVIFDPLVQIPPASAGESYDNLDNLGLGLYIAREIVEAHGGIIGVDSEPGRGSRFYFRLPPRKE